MEQGSHDIKIAIVAAKKADGKGHTKQTATSRPRGGYQSWWKL